jgi:hypothetical protein
LILLLAVLAGLLAGWMRARVGKRPLQASELEVWWLAVLAFLPQFFAFYLPATRPHVPDLLAALALVSSQALLLAFTLANFRQPGFWIMGVGLVLNLTVILLNGGLMPISPETIDRLYPALQPDWEIGRRFGSGKDIVLPFNDTILGWLSDVFVISFIGRKIAFSLGDIFISAGVFWFLWAQGSAHGNSSS